jgi:hypothetical protein
MPTAADSIRLMKTRDAFIKTQEEPWGQNIPGSAIKLPALAIPPAPPFFLP